MNKASLAAPISGFMNERIRKEKFMRMHQNTCLIIIKIENIDK